MQTRKEEIQMHAKVQLVTIIKIIGVPSKIPFKTKTDRNGKYCSTSLLILKNIIQK